MFGIAPNAFFMMATVLSLLLVASLVAMVLRFKSPDKDFSELTQRINSWWIMIGLLFAVLAAGQTVAIVFFGFFKLPCA